MQFALVAINVRFLYIICSFEILKFSQLLIQDGRRIGKSYLLVIFAVLSK